MNFKMIALAAAALASSTSMAAIAPGGTGNGELFVSMFDDTAKVSYTLDLGVAMDSFFVDAQAASGYTRSWSLAIADGNFTNFLGRVSSANLRWAVLASDTAGNTSPGGQNLFTTARAGTDAAVIASPTNLQFSAFNSAAQLGVFITNVNLTGSHSIPGDPISQTNYVVNGSSVNAESDTGRTYFYTELGGTTAILGNLRFDSAVGESTGFYGMTRSSNSINGLPVIVDQFDNPDNKGVFSLTGSGSNYVLNYSLAPAVAVIPEPGTYALLLVGLSAVGFVARRKSVR